MVARSVLVQEVKNSHLGGENKTRHHNHSGLSSPPLSMFIYRYPHFSTILRTFHQQFQQGTIHRTTKHLTKHVSQQWNMGFP